MLDQLFTYAWDAWLSDTFLVLIGMIGSLFVYGFLIDQTFFEDRGRLGSLRFRRVDIIAGTLLAMFFLLLTLAGIRAAAQGGEQTPALPGPTQMIVGTIISAAIFAIIIAGILVSLTARRIPWRDCFGLTRLGPAAVVGWGVALVLAALPLVAGAVAVSRLLLASEGYVDDAPQDIVLFLKENSSPAARWVVAIFAVVVAPMEEEFLFRGYLYGILRRYAGPPVGIVLNAVLFAAIHQHLPSFGGLFVLAVCLTLAYEWTGSLFVPMVMHAIFNSFTVAQLLTGG